MNTYKYYQLKDDYQKVLELVVENPILGEQHCHGGLIAKIITGKTVAVMVEEKGKREWRLTSGYDITFLEGFVKYSKYIPEGILNNFLQYPD